MTAHATNSDKIDSTVKILPDRSPTSMRASEASYRVSNAFWESRITLPGNLRASSLMAGMRDIGETSAHKLQKDGLEVSNTVLAALTSGMSSPFATC